MKKVAIVTGSSRGIGRGIAISLAKDGYHLVINYAGNAVAAETTARDCVAAAEGEGHQIEAIPVRADVGCASARRHLVEETRQHFGRVTLLVNNAGITSIGRADLLEAKEENYDKLMAINLKGPFFLTQAVAKWMIEESEKDPKFRPKIVTISSISA